MKNSGETLWGNMSSPVGSARFQGYRGGQLPLEDLKLEQLKIRWLRVSYWGLLVWQHQHLASPYWRFYWNEQAGAYLKVDGVEYALLPDTLTLICPNTSFATRLEGQTYASHDNVVVGGPMDQLESTLAVSDKERAFLPHFFVHFTIHEPNWTDIKGIVQLKIGPEAISILREISSSHKDQQGKLRVAQTWSLQSFVMRCLAQCPEEGWGKARYEERIQGLIDWMDLHLGEKISNADLAKRFDMSTNGFARMFKKATGCSPQDFLMSRRLQQACIMLHHSRDSIDTIAERCGFCDRNYFSVQFKKHFDVGPSAYRKAGIE